MNKQWPPRAGAATIAILALFAGCRFQPDVPPPVPRPSAAAPDLDAEIARASELKRPMLVLITESGASSADDSAPTLLEFSNIATNANQIATVLLDLSISRNRATAARYHVVETPVLLCLSPRGVIVSRDENPLTVDLVKMRIDEGARRGREVDAKLALLEDAIKDATDVGAELALTDFLQKQQNMREAIPHLAAVARSDTADTSLRIRAWVDLGLAHLWIAEPEKGRHEAEALILAWGGKIPEARAGGKLVLASQDAKAKRTARARQEFEEAIAAAPDSVYARQASEGLARLPRKEK